MKVPSLKLKTSGVKLPKVEEGHKMFGGNPGQFITNDELLREVVIDKYIAMR